MDDAAEPSIEDWAEATTMVVIVDALGDPTFRAEMKEMGHDLERFGLAAHRNADVWEGRSHMPRAFTKEVQLWEHTRPAILTKLEGKYTSRHWLPIGPWLDKLDHAEAQDVGALRGQAAKLLDAALLVEEWLCWYEIRSKIVGAEDLVNDTIVAIMLAWNHVRHGETAKRITAQLSARNLSLSAKLTPERLKTAMNRHRTRVSEALAAGQVEAAGPFVPRLRPVPCPVDPSARVTSEG